MDFSPACSWRLAACANSASCVNPSSATPAQQPLLSKLGPQPQRPGRPPCLGSLEERMAARCDNRQPGAQACCRLGRCCSRICTLHVVVQCIALSCNTFATTTCVPCTACMQAGGLKDCDGLVASIYKHLWLKNQQGRTCGVNIPQTVRRMALANTQSSALHY